MKYIEGDISLKLSNILDKKLETMLSLIFEFNSEVISEINYEFPSVASQSTEFKESLIEKIILYSEMYEKIKINEVFDLEIDKSLVLDFNRELDEFKSVSDGIVKGIEKSDVDLIKKHMVSFESICKEYNEEIILAGDYDIF
ncbi:MAG: hypothetical protein ACRCWG_00035 [Sarcina sp.]